MSPTFGMYRTELVMSNVCTLFENVQGGFKHFLNFLIFPHSFLSFHFLIYKSNTDNTCVMDTKKFRCPSLHHTNSSFVVMTLRLYLIPKIRTGSEVGNYEKMTTVFLCPVVKVHINTGWYTKMLHLLYQINLKSFLSFIGL